MTHIAGTSSFVGLMETVGWWVTHCVRCYWVSTFRGPDGARRRRRFCCCIRVSSPPYNSSRDPSSMPERGLGLRNKMTLIQLCCASDPDDDRRHPNTHHHSSPTTHCSVCTSRDPTVGTRIGEPVHVCARYSSSIQVCCTTP